MSLGKKFLIILVAGSLGIWGCAQNQSANAERLRALENKIARLEEDFKASVAVREQLRKRLTAVEEALSRIGCEAPHTDMDTQRVSARVEGGADQLRDIVRTLDERNIEVDDVGLRRPTLDEVFLAVTGRPLEPTDPDSDPQPESADAA